MDNHTHANSVAPGDADADALPIDGLAPFEVPAPLRPDQPDWLAAYQALYTYPHADLSKAHMEEFRGTMQAIAGERGDQFPTWVLDQYKALQDFLFRYIAREAGRLGMAVRTAGRSTR